METAYAHGLIAELEQVPSLEARLTDRLRQLITSGALPERSPLRLRDLARDFGVSPTPVRASLSSLERDGLVVIGRTGRAAVSPLTLEDVEEIYAARRGMEALAARRGAPMLTADALDDMASLLRELEAAAQADTLDTYLAVTWRFHARCYRAASRPRLVDEIERLFWRAVRYHRILLSSPERFAASVSTHRRFFDACDQRDGVAAERVVEESVRWSVDAFARVLGDREERKSVVGPVGRRAARGA
jgi:GntR family transcriptional regulator, rspAB operon transcriptional repressor